jgi:hypothetical protein
LPRSSRSCARAAPCCEATASQPRPGQRLAHLDLGHLEVGQHRAVPPPLAQRHELRRDVAPEQRHLAARAGREHHLGDDLARAGERLLLGPEERALRIEHEEERLAIARRPVEQHRAPIAEERRRLRLDRRGHLAAEVLADHRLVRGERAIVGELRQRVAPRLRGRRRRAEDGHARVLHGAPRLVERRDRRERRGRLDGGRRLAARRRRGGWRHGGRAGI